MGSTLSCASTRSSPAPLSTPRLSTSARFTADITPRPSTPATTSAPGSRRRKASRADESRTAALFKRLLSRLLAALGDQLFGKEHVRRREAGEVLLDLADGLLESD